ESIVLRDDSSIDIAEKSVRAVKGTPLRQKEQRCPLLRVELGSETLERPGGLRARTSPTIPLYVGGPIRVSQPLFSWAPIPGSETYRLTLRDNAGATLWQEVTTGLSVRYPASKSELRPGSYEWEVRAVAGAKTLAEQSAAFEV